MDDQFTEVTKEIVEAQTLVTRASALLDGINDWSTDSRAGECRELSYKLDDLRFLLEKLRRK